MKNTLIGFAVILFVFFPVATTLAFSGAEVHIDSKGNTTISEVKVMQLAGGTLFTRIYWGDSYIRLTIKTNNNTRFYRETGEGTTIAEIAVGNILDIAGTINSGSDVLTITATSIKNNSVQKKQNIFSGKVTGIDLSAGSFTLSTSNSGNVTVKTSSGTQFIKGSRNLDLAHLLVGDTITKTSGDYDIPTKTLQASSVTTFVPVGYYSPKNFQGKLVEGSSSSLPTTIKVSIDGKIYTVQLNSSTSILNTARKSVLLSRFVVGDTIRLYGAIREVDEPIIDAEIVRNTNL